MLNQMPEAEAFLPYHNFVLLRFARWDEVLAGPPVDEKMRTAAFFSHYARAAAFAAKGQPAQAEAERTAMEALYKQIPSDSIMGYNSWASVHDVAAHTLAARIAAARGDASEPSNSGAPPWMRRTA